MTKFSIIVLSCALAAFGNAATFTLGTLSPKKDVHFDKDAMGLSLTGYSGVGTTSPALTFTSTVNLKAEANGAAAGSASGDGFTSLLIAPVSPVSFSALGFALTGDKNTSIEAIVNGVSLGSLQLGSGNTMFTILGDGAISSVQLLATGGMVDTIKQVGYQQTQAVPEPASMAALGLGAFGILKRRKKA